MPDFVQLWVYLSSAPLFGLTATLVVYLLAQRFYAAMDQAPWANPVLWSIVVLALFVPAAHHPVSAAFATFLLGTLVAIGPALQIRLMDVAGDAQTLAAALNHSAFNAANALGAWLGGVGIAAGLGWTSTGWVGVLLGFGGVAMFAWALISERNTKRGAA